MAKEAPSFRRSRRCIGAYGSSGVEVESGDERDFDNRIFSAEDVAEGTGGVFLRIEKGALFPRVDDPDPFDADGEIFLDFREHAYHAVFRRENFDDKKWGDGGDGGADVVVAPDCEVGYAVAGEGDLYCDFRKYADAQFGPELVEQVLRRLPGELIMSPCAVVGIGYLGRRREV